VADNGTGLDESERSRVFDRFFSTRASGRGLGLAIVQRIVESHGGTVTVESRNGSGTRFQVWLPVSGH
jgi:signal transduction histidine kinase